MKTNKELEKLVSEIHKMSGIGEITLTERIQKLINKAYKKGIRQGEKNERQTIDCVPAWKTEEENRELKANPPIWRT